MANKMEASIGPVRTQASTIMMSLTGYLFPFRDAKGDVVHPVFLSPEGSDALHLPCFSTIKKLRETMEMLEIAFVGVKHIDDGLEFLRALPKSLDGKALKVMCDPYRSLEGKIRYVEIPLDQEM